jgi:hypothetical protein
MSSIRDRCDSRKDLETHATWIDLQSSPSIALQSQAGISAPVIFRHGQLLLFFGRNAQSMMESAFEFEVNLESSQSIALEMVLDHVVELKL